MLKGVWRRRKRRNVYLNKEKKGVLPMRM